MIEVVNEVSGRSFLALKSLGLLFNVGVVTLLLLVWPTIRPGSP